MSANGQPDSDWVASVLRQYEGRLIQYAQRFTGDAERARDAVQETFLKLCQAGDAEVDGHLPQWLYTVCRNQAIDIRRKESRMNTVADIPVTPDEHQQPEPWQQVSDSEGVQSILGELERLPPSQQECIRLKLQHGLSYRDISGVTGLSISNVGFLLHTGLKTLRQRLRRE